MHRISDVNKIDLALTSANLNGAATGAYYPLGADRKALFVVEIGAMAAAATSAMQIMQATNAAGGGAAVVTPATATITANTRVAAATLSVASAAGGVHVAGQTVTVNGLVFTAAAADVPTTRTYAVGATGAASATALFNKITSTNPSIGVPGVSAAYAVVGADEVITLTSTIPGERTITAVAAAATTVVATLRAVGFVEVDASQLNVAGGFGHVALRVTNSAAMQTGAVLLRGNGRYTPTQAVAASAA